MPVSMEDYRVELDCYAGPLDLLLFLVRRHEVDLNDIPIAKLTEQYLAHLKLIQQIDVNLAGEFLVMAATLLEIKSAMLVPRVEAPEGEPADTQASTLQQLDPRYELVQQLLAYKRFKDAADALEARRVEWDSRVPHRPAHAAGPGAAPPSAAVLGEDPEAMAAAEFADDAVVEIDLEDVHVLDLCAAFARILDSIGQNTYHEVVYDDTPIQLHAEDILDRLRRDAVEGGMTLQQIFVGRKTRSEMIGLFLATLELVRQKRVRVVQDQDRGEIRLELRPESESLQPTDDRPADWRDAQTGEVQYEWPSENERARAERRAKLRASWAGRHESEELEIVEVITDSPAEVAAVEDPATQTIDESDADPVDTSDESEFKD